MESITSRCADWKLQCQQQNSKHMQQKREKKYGRWYIERGVLYLITEHVQQELKSIKKKKKIESHPKHLQLLGINKDPDFLMQKKESR